MGRLFFKAAFVLGCVGIAYASVTPSLAPPGDYQADKMVHVAAFAVLAGAGSLAVVSMRWRVRLMAGAAALGLGLELVQGMIPGRTASGFDCLADLLGLVLGAVLIQGLLQVRRRSRLTG